MNAMKQVLYFGFSTLALKGLGFALLPISTRLLTQSQFGELNFLVSISAVLSLLLCLGLPELIFKQQSANPKQKLALFRDSILLSILINGLFLITTLMFTEPLLSLLPVALNPIDIKFLAINLVLSSALTILFCYLRYYEMAKHFLWLALLQGISQTTITITFLYLGYGVTGVMASGILASLLTLVVTTSIVLKNITISFNVIKWTISYKDTLFLCSIIMSSLFVYTNNGAENWFIVESVGKEKLAQYYVALQFAIMTSFTFEPIRMWWFSRRFKELSACPKNYVYLCELSLDIGILLCTIMLVLTPFVFTLVLPSNYLLNSWLLPSLICIVVLRHHSDLLNIGCYIHRNGFYVSAVNGISALTALILLVILVPLKGILGAVIALFIAQLIKTLLFFFISQKLEKLPYSIKRLIPSWVGFSTIYLLSISQLEHLLLWQVAFFTIYTAALFKKYKSPIRTALDTLFERSAHD